MWKCQSLRSDQRKGKKQTKLGEMLVKSKGKRLYRKKTPSRRRPIRMARAEGRQRVMSKWEIKSIEYY